MLCHISFVISFVWGTPRYSTFLRAWNGKWSSVLAFRHKTTFSQCDVCYRLKEQLQSKSVALEQRLGALRLYRGHLRDQYADRAALWSLRALSSDWESDTLLLVTDGADQSKFALPRDAGLRGLASWSNLQRPRCKVHGVWALGWCLTIGVLDDDQAHDSTCVLELVSQTLERVNQMCTKESRRFPSVVLLWADNTVREAKNQYVLKYLAALCGKFLVKTTGLLFLRKSHTHDLIGRELRAPET